MRIFTNVKLLPSNVVVTNISRVFAQCEEARTVLLKRWLPEVRGCLIIIIIIITIIIIIIIIRWPWCL